MSMARKRVHVYYSGMVQGVGFRFTVEHLGRRLGVSGWVRNNPDSRVELLGEGEEELLKVFLEKVRNGPLKRYIHHVETSWSEATGDFKSFDIRF